MSAHDKSAIPRDATAVSAITRAQKDFQRPRCTEDISCKAHLDISVKRVMADPASTERCASNHFITNPWILGKNCRKHQRV
jgi:hypothetical protein